MPSETKQPWNCGEKLASGNDALGFVSITCKFMWKMFTAGYDRLGIMLKRPPGLTLYCADWYYRQFGFWVCLGAWSRNWKLGILKGMKGALQNKMNCMLWHSIKSYMHTKAYHGYHTSIQIDPYRLQEVAPAKALCFWCHFSESTQLLQIEAIIMRRTPLGEGTMGCATLWNDWIGHTL